MTAALPTDNSPHLALMSHVAYRVAADMRDDRLAAEVSVSLFDLLRTANVEITDVPAIDCADCEFGNRRTASFRLIGSHPDDSVSEFLCGYCTAVHLAAHGAHGITVEVNR